MAELIPFMFADLGAPLAPALFPTDAQGGEGDDAGGFGIVASIAGRVNVQQILSVGMRAGFWSPSSQASTRVGGSQRSRGDGGRLTRYLAQESSRAPRGIR